MMNKPDTGALRSGCVIAVALIASMIGLSGCSGESPSEALESKPALGSELALGVLAPDFALPGSDGNQHELADLAGDYVVLAFFPKAFTGG